MVAWISRGERHVDLVALPLGLADAVALLASCIVARAALTEEVASSLELVLLLEGGDGLDHRGGKCDLGVCERATASGRERAESSRVPLE